MPFDRIILVTIDCLRADHIGLIGGHNLTPNMDKLAREGLLFMKAFSNGFATSQSFVSIFSSTYPLVSTVMNLNPYLNTLAESLEKGGYLTLGLHSNPFLSKMLGWSKGFRIFYDFMDVIKSPSRMFVENEFVGKILNRILPYEKNVKTWNLFRKIYYKVVKFQIPYIDAEVLTDIATKVITKIVHAGNKRFFLWIHYMDPHAPYVPPHPYLEHFSSRKEAFMFNIIFDLKKFQSRYNTSSNVEIDNYELITLKNLYKGEVLYVDENIGKFITFLEEENLLNNTLFILTADHGEAFFEHGKFGHDYNTPHNEVIHVPLLIYGKEFLPRLIIDYPVQLLDLAPTILDLLGLKNPSSFMGTSIKSIIGDYVQSKLKKNVPIFSESAKSNVPELKYDDGIKVISCIKFPWKIIVNEEEKSIELYDLNRDFSEKNNLAQFHVDVVEELKEAILRHLFEVMKMRHRIKLMERYVWKIREQCVKE
ncbi:MAG: sulfatase [Nitrososphaerota archaeon]